MKTRLDLSDLAALILASSSIMMFTTSIVWAISGETTDKWFSRFFLSMVCLGFFGIIRKISK